MFDRLKNRLHRKDYDDAEDIRSSVLGDFRMPQEPEPDFPRPNRKVEVPAWDDPTSPQQFDSPPGFGSIDMRQPAQMQSERGSRDYDIMDRLSLIESQLSAIRSQTETINERLKNMERSMGRRY